MRSNTTIASDGFPFVKERLRGDFQGLASNPWLFQSPPNPSGTYFSRQGLKIDQLPMDW